MIPFQWSIKLDSGEIYMVQAETSVELGLAIEEIKSKFLSKPMQKNENLGKSMQIEDCPKCGALLVASVTKTGKHIKKCSTNKWDYARKEATGCDYVDWGKSDYERDMA